MTQYNILNVKLSNSQLHKLKSVIKDGTKVTSKISSNVVGDFNDENNFPHKLLLTNTRFSKLCKAFANGLSANIKLLETQLHKIGQSGGFLSRLLGLLLKTGLPLMKNVLKPLVKSVLIPLEDAAIHKKIFGYGNTTLIISNEEMNHMKITKSLEKTIKSEA